MTILTRGLATVIPDLVLGYEAESEATTIEHQLIGGGLSVSVSADLPRAGVLALFFVDRADAWAAHDLHLAAGVWTLTDPDFPELNMQYVRKGSMTIKLDEDTRIPWLLTVGYRAVL